MRRGGAGRGARRRRGAAGVTGRAARDPVGETSVVRASTFIAVGSFMRCVSIIADIAARDCRVPDATWRMMVGALKVRLTISIARCHNAAEQPCAYGGFASSVAGV